MLLSRIVGFTSRRRGSFRVSFSLIINSRNDQKFAQVSAAYANALMGENYEVIRIPDSKSMAEGYLRGIEQSSGEQVIFSHDDAAPLRPGFGTKLRKHLAQYDIIGGAGTSKLIGPQWFSAGPPWVFGAVSNVCPPQFNLGIGFNLIPNNKHFVLQGIVKDSIPAQAGVRNGDQLVSIGGIEVGVSPELLQKSLNEFILSHGSTTLKLGVIPVGETGKKNIYVDYGGKPPTINMVNLSIFGIPRKCVGGIQAADGFFLACNRSVLKEVTFDAEMCDTFHMYDVDWTYRAFRAGVRIGIANDLYLAHASTGGYNDPYWRPQADRWMAKYGHLLPTKEHKQFQYALTTAMLPSMESSLWLQDELLGQLEE